MASTEASPSLEATILERITRVETTLETERPHLATKADLERHTRLIVMWMIGTQIAVVGLLISVLGNG